MKNCMAVNIFFHCLKVPEIVFIPSMDEKNIDGIFCLVDGLLGDVYRQASFVPRISSHSGVESYQVCDKFHHVILSIFFLGGGEGVGVDGWLGGWGQLR
jgi:dynein heavy chain